MSRDVNSARPLEKEPVKELVSTACPSTWYEIGLRDMSGSALWPRLASAVILSLFISLCPPSQHERLNRSERRESRLLFVFSECLIIHLKPPTWNLTGSKQLFWKYTATEGRCQSCTMFKESDCPASFRENILQERLSSCFLTDAVSLVQINSYKNYLKIQKHILLQGSLSPVLFG